MRKAKRRAPNVVALIVLAGSDAAGVAGPRARARFGRGSRSIPARGLDRSRRLDGQRSSDRPDSGRLFVARHRIRPGSLRWRSISKLASAAGPTTPKHQDFVAAGCARWHAVDRYVQWAGKLEGWATDPLSRDYGPGVSSLLEDYQGTIWLGGKEKVCAIRQGRFDCRDDLKNAGPSTYGYLQGGVFSLHEDTQHRLWAGAESGLWQWQPGPPRRVLAQPVGIFGAVVQGDQPTALTVITGSPQGRQLREITDDKKEMYTVPGADPAFYAQPPAAG